MFGFVVKHVDNSAGVLHWNLDPSKYENDPELNKIREERKYTYHDFVDSSKMPNLKEKLATFLIE